MKYPRILSAIRSARWAITPGALNAIVDTLGSHMRGSGIRGADLPPIAQPPVAPAQEQESQVAVIPVMGILGKHLSELDMACGGCDVDSIGAAIDAAVADEAIRALVLDFDSPGGVVTGIPELADRIRGEVSGKPLVAFTGAQCCSAAYWLASACGAVFATKSADLGSIGVYMALIDDSEWWKKEGFKLELIKAGKHKADGISGQPLSDEARARFQSDVDACYEMFTADVRSGRGTVSDEVMQGQTFMGRAAVGAGLVDDIVPSLEAVVSAFEANLPALK